MAGSRDNASISSTIEERMRIQEVIHILKDWRKAIGWVAFFTVIGSLVSHTLSIPSYNATAKLEVVGQRENLLSKIGSDIPTLASYGQDNTQEVQKHMAHLRSFTFYLAVAEKLIDQPEYRTLNLTQPEELSILKPKFWDVRFGRQIFSDLTQNKHLEHNIRNVEWLAGIIQNATSIDSDGLQWISISVKTFDSITSVIIANFLAEKFSKITEEREQNELNELRKFLNERMIETKELIKRHQVSLVEFKKSNGALSLGGADKVYADQLKEIEGQLGTARLKVQENLNLIAYYKAKLNEQTEAVLSSKPEQVISATDPRVLSRKFDGLRRQKYLLTVQGLGENDEKVKDIDTEIRKTVELLRTKINGVENIQDDELPLNSTIIRGKMIELRKANSVIETEIAALELTRKNLFLILGEIPRVDQELYSKTEGLKLEYELFSSLKKKLQDIEIQRLAIKPPIRVDENSRAAPQEKKINLFLRIFFAALTGSFLGGIGVLLLELANTSIKHGSDIEACDLTILGNIPNVESKVGALLGENEVKSDLLVCASRPNSVEAMAFKYVREQLRVQLNNQGKPVKTVTITGVDQHTGKSLISANLAVSIAKLDKKVILMDCDFRIPNVHKYFNLEPTEGLTTILGRPDLKYEDLILKTPIRTLDILPCGRSHPNPTELVGSDMFRALLAKLYQVYDFIILDAPPAVYVADAPVMAALTDMVVIVARYRMTTRGRLLMAHRKIFQISHKRAYAILNCVPVIAHEYVPYTVTTRDELRKAG